MTKHLSSVALCLSLAATPAAASVTAPDQGGPQFLWPVHGWIGATSRYPDGSVHPGAADIYSHVWQPIRAARACSSHWNVTRPAASLWQQRRRSPLQMHAVALVLTLSGVTEGAVSGTDAAARPNPSRRRGKHTPRANWAVGCGSLLSDPSPVPS